MPSVSGNVWALIIQILMFYNNYRGVQVYTLLRTSNLANLVTTCPLFLRLYYLWSREECKIMSTKSYSWAGGITHIFAYTSPNLCISQYRPPITVFMEHLQFEFQKELLWTDLGKCCGSLLWFIRFG